MVTVKRSSNTYLSEYKMFHPENELLNRLFSLSFFIFNRKNKEYQDNKFRFVIIILK